MENLKPCPFCGGEADCNDGGICDKDGNPVWWVECLSCGANVEGSENTEEAAMLAWNTRPTPTPEALSLGQLMQMDGEPVMVLSDITIMRMLYNSSLEYNVGTVKLHRHMYLDVYEDVIEYSGGTCSRLDDCGRNIVAYRFKPEEV